MRWRGERRSSNVEDRRGVGGGLAIGGGGALIVLIIAMLMGADPRALLEQIQSNSVPSGTTTAPGAPGAEGVADDGREFVAVVLAATEDVWHEQFRRMGREYREPTLVLFSDGVQSACGMASSAVGPFYCPGDQRVYIDLDFYELLRERFKAPGDFAQAYVIAHEVGHHVQNLLGITDEVHDMRARLSKEEYNALSVRLELQADFLAGVWAHHTQRMRRLLEEGDIEEALGAASAIGDDRLQMETQGRVVPDSFTHGTSEQRVHWFRKGYETGDMEQGDTFNARVL